MNYLIILFVAITISAEPCCERINDLEKKLIHRNVEIDVLVEHYYSQQSSIKWRNIGAVAGGIIATILLLFGYLKGHVRFKL